METLTWDKYYSNSLEAPAYALVTQEGGDYKIVIGYKHGYWQYSFVNNSGVVQGWTKMEHVRNIDEAKAWAIATWRTS